MSITSLSFTFVNTYAPQSAKPAAESQRASGEAAAEPAGCDGPRHGGRPNRLVEAMMSALRELGFGAPAASGSTAGTPASTGTASAASSAGTASSASTTGTAATPAAAGTDATTASDTATATAAAAPAATLESAVQQFAHALFQALRQGGNGDSSGEASSRVEGEQGHRHHHHGHHGWRGQGYDDLSQRLETLAQGFGNAAPAAAAAAAGPTAAPSVTVTLTVDDGTAATSTPASTGNAGVPAAIASAETAVAPKAAVVAKNPLLEAFSKLFAALKPLSTTTPSTTETDMAAKLRSFLHTLAQAIEPDTASTVRSAQVGGLVNVTA